MPGLNQGSKQWILFKLIDRAIALCREQGESIKGVELFCADGFYANYAVQRGAESVMGIDNDTYQQDKARLITKLLHNEGKISFAERDVFDLPDSYDFCICAGGLYHLSNPSDLLKLLRESIHTALVIQTVYSLAIEAEDYFETPAPHWTWGCRFSHLYLLQMVTDCGWEILESHTNELKGNKRPEDRGSAYLLCVPE
ncbi:MAG: class I SAM-dependent methyltransferase [Candidatus Dadabacteria bacterium]|nr:class I SAM-dependent methyltransferase [Candidatus Dadabacteria bacterium]